ncbi:hypothetical protein EV202_1471, partial [Bacteroides heparinolyticus]
KRGDKKEKEKEIQKVKKITNRNKSEGRRADISPDMPVYGG